MTEEVSVPKTTPEVLVGKNKKEIIRTSWKKSFKKDWRLYSLLIIPFTFLFIFKYIPMAGNIIAFRKFVPGGFIFGEEWVGLRYIKMFINDPTFWKVFRNTLTLGGATLLFTFPLPIAFALLLNEITNKKFKKMIQTASYLPHFLSTVIVAGILLELLASKGAINMVVQFFTGETIAFIQSPEWFRTIYVGSEIWQRTGYGAILYLAALTNIDESLYEAAKIDGANRWKQTLFVTIPGILPTVVTVFILNVGSFMAVGFEKIILLYNPLTYSTGDVISSYLYRVGLQSNNFSYATAIGLFESIIGLTLVLSSNKISQKLTQRSLW